MIKLSVYEKETIFRTSEADDCWEIYTFNPKLKRRLAAYAQKQPELCQLLTSTAEGSETYRISKRRVTIQLTESYSEERRKAARESCKKAVLVRKV